MFLLAYFRLVLWFQSKGSRLCYFFGDGVHFSFFLLAWVGLAARRVGFHVIQYRFNNLLRVRWDRVEHVRFCDRYDTDFRVEGVSKVVKGRFIGVFWEFAVLRLLLVWGYPTRAYDVVPQFLLWWDVVVCSHSLVVPALRVGVDPRGWHFLVYLVCVGRVTVVRVDPIGRVFLRVR